VKYLLQTTSKRAVFEANATLELNLSMRIPGISRWADVHKCACAGPDLEIASLSSVTLTRE
jgi:hypothetical protein